MSQPSLGEAEPFVRYLAMQMMPSELSSVYSTEEWQKNRSDVQDALMNARAAFDSNHKIYQQFEIATIRKVAAHFVVAVNQKRVELPVKVVQAARSLVETADYAAAWSLVSRKERRGER